MSVSGQESEELESGEASAVYGPVRSWRVGLSLGVDLLLINSICSFRCLYCQLGKINVRTLERKIYVPTMKVMNDLERSAWAEADIVTISGSGEPTLAANMGEVIGEIKARTLKPVLVLTNSTTLSEESVRRDLTRADAVFCKLDSADGETFKIMNRPVEGVTLGSVVEGIKRFRSEFDGRMGIQIMLTRFNQNQVEQLAALLEKIRPDEVQLSTPMRPIPRTWNLEARGNSAVSPYPASYMKSLVREEVIAAVTSLRRLTGLKIISAYS